MDGRKAIVCVDDEIIILMALKLELARRFKGRFHIEAATNAQEAIDRIEALYADGIRVILVLTDWLMPGIRGDELVARVKRDHPDIRCVLISGQVDSKWVAESGLGTVLDAFIRKPWRSDQLMKTILPYVDPEGSLG